MASDATVSTHAPSAEAVRFTRFPAEGTFVQGWNESGAPVPFRGWMSVHPDDRRLGVEQARVILIRLLPGSQDLHHFDLGRVRPDALALCDEGSDIGCAPEFFPVLAGAAHRSVALSTQVNAARETIVRTQQEAVEARRELERTRAQHTSQLDSILADANELAEDHDWCSVYDDLLERHGLPAREKDYEVEVRATFQVRVTVSARDYEAAREKVEDEQVADRLYELGRAELTAALSEFETEEG